MSVDADRSRRININAALTRPEQVEPRLQRRHPIFRLRRSPSLRGVARAWVVVGPAVRRPGSRPIVREVHIGPVTPDAPDGIHVRDAEIDPDLADTWVRQLHTIRIPIGGVEKNIGLDGTTYTLSTEAGFATAELRWWWKGPPAWSELTAWARRTMTALHACVAPDEPLDFEG